MTKVKDKLLRAFDMSPIEVGEKVQWEEPSHSGGKRKATGTVTEIEGKLYTIKDENGYSIVKKTKKEIIHRLGRNKIGFNPFLDRVRIRPVNFALSTIVSKLRLTKKYESERYERYGKIDLVTLQWNPYVFGRGGSKIYYQRDFVWTLIDKQNLIRSMYAELEVGRIVIRDRSFDWINRQLETGNTDVALYDIVDGKQRLKTLEEWFDDEFPDEHGNYWSDLSTEAQWKFRDSQLLLYCEMDEKTSDKAVLQSFLQSNIGGIPMSKTHLDWVEDIYKHNFEPKK